MKHLTKEQLVDVAEGTMPRPAHLASCEACRREVDALRAAMARVTRVDVPEPSPLFWEQLSARVSEAVAREPVEQRRPESRAWPTHSRWRAWLAPIFSMPGVLVPLSLGVVAAVALAVLLHGPGSTVVAVPVPPMADSAVPAEAVPGTAMLPPDDPALDMVADLGSQLGWQAIHDSGIVRHSGVVDRAVSGLSANERAELGRLLKQELAGGGD